ncbi:hypothetical protein ACNOYE_39575 [Nannocystaceae bacterium ST9]
MLHARTTALLLALAPIACFQASSNDDGVADESSAGETSVETSGNDDPAGTDESATDSAGDEAPDTGSETASEPYCGNGLIEDGETCDAQDVGEMTCASFGHASGEITCNVDCTLDVGGCYTCGDAQLDGFEACDSSNLAGQNCIDLGFQAGELACSGDCLVFDTAACVPYPACGNGQVDLDQGEQCEGAQLDGKSCLDLGFAGGTLACTPGCLFDTSGCAQCGNGVREDGEECDEFDFGGDNCQDYGFTQGFLSCTPECTVETYDCCIGLNCQFN